MLKSGIRPFAVRALALLAALASGTSDVRGQETSSARAYCLKATEGRASELESLMRDVAIPVEKGRVAAGKTKGFDLLRAVVPAGSDARCDYLAVFRYATLPEAVPADGLGEDLKRAGLSLTAQQILDKLNAVSRLVSLEWWWFAEHVGPAWPKGTYVNINFWKIRPDGFADYLAAERKYWKPMAEAYVAAGRKTSWDLVGLWAPFRADGYQGMTFDAFHDWKAMMDAQSAFEETWKKLNPDLDFALVERLKQGIRTSTHNELYRLIETTTN